MVFSLKAKIALLAAGALCVFGAVLAATTYRTVEERRQETEAHAVSLARRIAQAPVAEIRTLLPVLAEIDPNVVFVVFTDREGRVLARHARPPEQGGPPAGELERLTSQAYQGRADWKLVHVDIEDGAGQVGLRVRLGYSLAELHRKVAQDTRRLALLAGLLAALGLAGAALLARRVARPLEKLADAMRRVRYGELGSTVEITSRDEIADLARAFNEMSTELRSRERLRMNFARFVSSAVADKVISENRTVRLGGERRQVTVLFADLRGFTPLASRQSPEKVVALLNECFRALVDVIPRYGGTLDKFLGDGLMAVFNAPAELPVHEVCAVMAALDMQRVMRNLNERRRASGLEEVQLGIGINTGEAVAGTFGSERRLEYTVIGSAVNLAQRIEDHALGGELLLGETTYQAVRHLVEIRPQGPVMLKGLDTPVPLYKVLDLSQAVRGVDAQQTPVTAS